MKTVWIEDEDALNVGRVIVTKTGTKDCTVCYSCDEREDYENRLKADLVAMLSEILLEIEEQSLTHSEDNILSEWGLGYNHSVERCGELIQQKIDKYKAESEK